MNILKDVSWVNAYCSYFYAVCPQLRNLRKIISKPLQTKGQLSQCTANFCKCVISPDDLIDIDNGYEQIVHRERNKVSEHIEEDEHDP